MPIDVATLRPPRLAQMLLEPHPLGDEAVAGAVEAPALELELFGPLVRHGVVTQPRRNRGVKAGFKRRDERHFGHARVELAHRRDVRRVVGWADGVHFRHGFDHVAIDQLHARHASAVDGFETDGRHVGDGAQTASRRIGERRETGFDCCAMIRRL
jgi:hypothetical protein